MNEISYEAELANKVRLSIDNNDGAPFSVWSTGERLGVALVLGDRGYLSDENEDERSVLSRIAGDIGGSAGDADALVKRVRRRCGVHLSARDRFPRAEGEPDFSPTYLFGIASDLARIAEYLAEATGAVGEARRLAAELNGQCDAGVDGEPAGLDDAVSELEAAAMRLRHVDRIVSIAADDCEQARNT